MSRAVEQRTGNRYCRTLGIAAPDLAAVAAHKNAKLFYVMIAALLAGGDRMTIDEIAERLRAAGVRAGSGDLRTALLRSWHGRDPVVRDADGCFALQLDSASLDLILFIIGLRPARVAPQPPPPDVRLPGEHVPLSAAELDAAFRDRGLSSLSLLSQAAAVLEVAGRPMTIDEVNAVLAELTRYRLPLRSETPRSWKDRCVRQDGDGRLLLDRHSPALPAVRRAVRHLAETTLRQRALAAHWKERQVVWEQEREARQARERREAGALRRAVLRCLTVGGTPAALTLLDCGQRTLRTFAREQLGAAIAALDDYDVLAGLSIRDDLFRLGLDPDRWRLADLSPPQKTKRLNRRGRSLALTAELLIAKTTGISRSLGDPRRLAGYAAAGDWTRLRRRLEGDAKALYAFYRYGCLHGCVRLRWGFLDEVLGIGWAHPGDETVHEVLRAAGESDLPVDVVLHTSPGWQEPWARALRVTVDQLDHYQAILRSPGEVRIVDLLDVQAARLVHDPPPRQRDAEGRLQPIAGGAVRSDLPDARTITAAFPCPCGSGRPYDRCCLGTLH